MIDEHMLYIYTIRVKFYYINNCRMPNVCKKEDILLLEKKLDSEIYHIFTFYLIHIF